MSSSDKSEHTTLSGHIQGVAANIRNRAFGTTSTSSYTEPKTAVSSTIGYQRWSGGQEPETPDAETGKEFLALQERTVEESHDSGSVTGSSVSGESSHLSEPQETENLDPGSIRSPSNRGSVVSLEITGEQPTNKTDTITEWQAGWNVTNAIQVCLL